MLTQLAKCLHNLREGAANIAHSTKNELSRCACQELLSSSGFWVLDEFFKASLMPSSSVVHI